VLVVRTSEPHEGYGWFTAELDTRGGPGCDRYVEGSWDLASCGSRPPCTGRTATGSPRSRATSARTRSASGKTRHMPWRVSTTIRSPEIEITDVAPDAGWYRH